MAICGFFGSFMRFRGITKLSIDAKGRVAIPKNHRENLSDNGIKELVVTVDHSSTCLLVYPSPVYEELERKVNELPNTSDYVRMLQRSFIGHATPIELDGTGRMLLPSELREFASLDKKGVLIGQGNKFELWDEKTWDIETGNWKQEVKNRDSADLPSELLNISF